MKIFEADDNLDEGFPNGLLVEGGVVFLVLDDFLVEVAIIREFHHNAKLPTPYQSELFSMKECLYPTM